MERKFEEKTLEKCLNLAEKKLSLSRNDFHYTIVSEDKNFLKKHCVIIVKIEGKEDEFEIPDILELDEKIKELESDIDAKIDANIDLKFDSKFDSKSVVGEQRNDEGILIDGDRIIIDAQESESFELLFKPQIKISINGESAMPSQKVTSKDEIKYEPAVIEGKREIIIQPKILEAKISIKYTPEYVEKLICNKMGNEINISSKMTKGRIPPLYTKQEIVNILKEKKIIFGLIEEALNEASSSSEVDELIVCKGVPAIDDVEDKVEVLFESTKRIIDENSRENVDYRNLFSTANVSSGNVLGEFIVGKVGNDGIDIYGNAISKKLKKNLQLKVANGCKIEDSKVIATIEGQPTFKSGTFYVHQVFQAPSDVDLKSGNINFIGDVKVTKNVLEGMKIEAGNSVTIGGNVETAIIIAQGEARIGGNVINSKINVGAKNMQKQKYKEDLEALCNEMKMLITYATEIKEKNLIHNRNDGEIIKVLIENKFKTLPKKAMVVLSYSDGEGIEEIKNLIRTRILGLGPLHIKFINELYTFVNLIEKESEPLSDNLMIPADIYVNYIQDSEINATGNIYVVGKGQYVSNLNSFGDIIFTVPNSISRGGVLSAKGRISARIVGSIAGVSTILKVPRHGEITADIAYNNTTFYFGERKYTLDLPAKNVRAYVDKEGEIIVEKFVL